MKTFLNAVPKRLRRALPFFSRKGVKVALQLSLIAGIAYGAFVWASLPSVDHLVATNPDETAYQTLWTQSHPTDIIAEPSWTPPSELPPLLFEALVQAEDNRYYQHKGVDWRTTRKAASRWLRGRSSGGGSTITQQLARNLFLTPSQNPHRKFVEILIALQIEREISKERILELYANVIEYGEGVWGITSAARHYFSKTPAELDPFEIVFLCSLLPAPRQALTDKNLARAIGVQKRISTNLFLTESISAESFVKIQNRLPPLRNELNKGRPTVEALALSKTSDP